MSRSNGRNWKRWGQIVQAKKHGRAAPRSPVITRVLVPREGQGDYRRPVALTQGHVAGGTVQYQERRSDTEPLRFVPIRNGLPESMTYQASTDWRRPGWQQRARRHGLDLEAIRKADAELIGSDREASCLRRLNPGTGPVPRAPTVRMPRAGSGLRVSTTSSRPTTKRSTASRSACSCATPAPRRSAQAGLAAMT